PRHKGQVYVESSSQPEAGLDVRVSEGPFKLVARARRAGNSLRTVFGPEFRPRFVSSHMTWRDGDQTRELPTKRLECRSIVKHTYTQQPRFCAFDQRGKLLGEPFIDADEISFGAPNEPKASDVARIDLLVRPTVQIHFRRIHLKPNPA
ncbi:MAG TPA: hypothetical protein VKT78_15325, partial [Fimbriimonadaceae bacterium]|nr:hypothetical protein [Fimbriimonadaceae bacterium]